MKKKSMAFAEKFYELKKSTWRLGRQKQIIGCACQDLAKNLKKTQIELLRSLVNQPADTAGTDVNPFIYQSSMESPGKTNATILHASFKVPRVR